MNASCLDHQNYLFRRTTSMCLRILIALCVCVYGYKSLVVPPAAYSFEDVVWETSPRSQLEAENNVVFFWVLQPDLTFLITNTTEISTSRRLRFNISVPSSCPDDTTVEATISGETSKVSPGQPREVSVRLLLAPREVIAVSLTLRSPGCTLSQEDPRIAFARISDVVFRED